MGCRDCRNDVYIAVVVFMNLSPEMQELWDWEK